MRAALVLFVAVLGLPTLTAAAVVVPIGSVQHFVNIRAEADAESDVIGRLYQGDNMPLVESVDGWHEIEIEPDLNGYISADWSTVFADAEAAAAAANAAEVPAASETESAEPVPKSSPEEVVEEAPAEEAPAEEAAAEEAPAEEAPAEEAAAEEAPAEDAPAEEAAAEEESTES